MGVGAMRLGAVILACAILAFLAPSSSAQSARESGARFEPFVSGLLVRKTFDPGLRGPVRAEIWDLMVGPGQVTGDVGLPGAAVLEVRSGEGSIAFPDEQGREEKLSTGLTLPVPEKRRFRLANQTRDRALIIRAVLMSRHRQSDAGGDRSKDPTIVRNHGDFKEDRERISPPTLQFPIYACASTVVVKDFIKGAKLEVFEGGNPIGGLVGEFVDHQPVEVTIEFSVGEVITARQTVDGVASGDSNAVTVTSHLDDYPGGLPKPRLSPEPLYQCGRAVGIKDVLPGALTEVYSENPSPGGGFLPAVTVGSVADFPYTWISPAFEKDARIHARSFLCEDKSDPSDVKIVAPELSPIPTPTMDDVHENAEIVVVRGPGGDPVVNGATIDVFTDSQPPGSERVGGQPSPGGGGQQILIDPPAVGGAGFWATQALCSSSDKSDPTTTLPCEDLPPAKIKPPIPGDTTVTVIESVPGAEILIFADGVEIGHSGGTTINLYQPIGDGETITVVQRLGDCESQSVQVFEVGCHLLGGDHRACSDEWPAFRHNGLRNAHQPNMSALADPYAVKKLGVAWTFDPPGSNAFRASPVVFDGRVFIGNGNGRFYALDAATGGVLWQFPPDDEPPLTTQFTSNPSSCGIAASAVIGRIKNERDVVIFGAPDQSIGAGLGSGRLFALDPSSGNLIWASPEIAVLDGLTPTSTSELHEQFGYSAPLVLGDKVYIGIGNHGDNPIQAGRVAAVDLSTGNPVPGFAFKASRTRGGGVWSAPSGGLDGQDVYVTTGNTRCWNGGCQNEPSPNHGLSMLRLDSATGDVLWRHQPVPFELDDDPDWATGMALMSASCGQMAASTMKDGWAYGVDSATGAGGAPPPASVRWQFPPTGFPFTEDDGTVHGDSRYLVPGGAWGNVYVSMMGGNLVTADIDWGFRRLHALNACAPGGNRLRWIADIPATGFGSYQLGPPSLTRGIVYVGTAQGHVVALADPAVWPTATSRCSQPDVPLELCESSGFPVVPEPKVLADIDLGTAPILAEPAIAKGRLFVASGSSCSSNGELFMLEPSR